jgi:hypothetical protein
MAEVQRRSRAPYVIFIGLAAVVAGGAFVWRQKATQAQCDALLDHFAEVVVKEKLGNDAGPAELAAEKQRERVEAAKSDDFKNCPSQVQPEEHDCAMKAKTSEAVIKCLE